MTGAVQQLKSASDRLLSGTSTIENSAALRLHEKFELIFVTAVVTANGGGLQALLDNISGDVKADRNPQQTSSSSAALGTKLDELANLHLHSLIGADPLDHVRDFTRRAAHVVIEILGLQGLGGLLYSSQYADSAITEFKVWLASPSSAAKWLSEYLNFNHQRDWVSRVSDDVASIQQALSDWLQAPSESVKRREEAWTRYRTALKELPDLKETMFAEQFGVRSVFVQPLARYKVALPDSNIGAIVPDVANLIASLISERVPGDELILLCGGPGSGKSTLCRIITSELANNPNMHPVFLRLRRLQDTQEISGFIETHLQREGIIDKFSDLADVPNLVLILDGFDELVMASGSRLREFFNALREDLGSGPLRNAKAIVSGRDTLFPNGSGLPTGSHVISLLPFDKPRLTIWGDKWRSLHPDTRAQSFHPEAFCDEKAEGEGHRAPPLHHLVSWPLTLHLVARVHTSGALNLAEAAKQQVEKAVLYKSIVLETALRQQSQSSGKGRLLPEKMREFISAISWEMYSTSRDALDYNEGLPLLKNLYPHATESELAELADVAIVNQPEPTKGEEGGFEFVHKNFSEYFIAERISHSLEKISFKSAEYNSNALTWRMSTKEAISELSSLLSIRVLMPEVQEMLEPMLADFKSFLGPVETDKKAKPSEVIRGLKAKKDRMEGIIKEYASGRRQPEVVEPVRGSRIVYGERDIHANFAVGLLILGCAISQRVNKLPKTRGKEQHYLQISNADLWSLVAIIQAGDVHFDHVLSGRCLSPIQLVAEGENIINNYPALRPDLLSGIKGASVPLAGTGELLLMAIDSIVRGWAVMFMMTLSQVFGLGRRDYRGYPSEESYPYRERWHRERQYSDIRTYQEDRYRYGRDIFENDLEIISRMFGLFRSSGILDSEWVDRVGTSIDRMRHIARSSDEAIHYLSRRPEEIDQRNLRYLANEFEELFYRSRNRISEYFMNIWENYMGEVRRVVR
jgi:hypothetical protein